MVGASPSRMRSSEWRQPAWMRAMLKAGLEGRSPDPVDDRGEVGGQRLPHSRNHF